MRPWYRATIRLFGVASILLAGVGLYTLAGTLVLSLRRPWVNALTPRYTMAAYSAMTAINVGCLILLLVVGVSLIRLRRRGLAIANWLFSLELVYFFLVGMLGVSLLGAGGGLHVIGGSLAAASGSGNVGIMPQIVTGFPVAALVLLNVAYRRLRTEGAGRS